MRDRNKTHVLNELAEKAGDRYIYDTVLCGGRFKDNERNASLVGQLVQDLPEEDRELLKGLTSDDISSYFAAYRRPRPQVPTHRRRGPVTLSKRKDRD